MKIHQNWSKIGPWRALGAMLAPRAPGDARCGSGDHFLGPQNFIFGPLEGSMLSIFIRLRIFRQFFGDTISRCISDDFSRQSKWWKMHHPLTEYHFSGTQGTHFGVYIGPLFGAQSGASLAKWKDFGFLEAIRGASIVSLRRQSVCRFVKIFLAKTAIRCGRGTDSGKYTPVRWSACRAPKRGFFLQKVSFCWGKTIIFMKAAFCNFGIQNSHANHAKVRGQGGGGPLRIQ